MGNPLLRNVSWVAVAFLGQQIVRFGTNVVLALIVTPTIFGVMLILTTLRSGLEQITDVGVGQNIVIDKMGNRPKFYNTAWTIQIIRGFILTAAFLLFAPLVADTFGEELAPILPLFAVLFLITGFATPARFLLQKNQKVGKLVAFDALVALSVAVFSVAFALISPTAESLVWALIASSILGAVLGAFLMNWRHLRLRLDKAIALRIISFGGWVFLSSLFYFAATSFDRLYLAAVIPLSILGVYGIARSFSDVAFQLAHQISTLIVFPKVAEANRSGRGIADIVRPRAIGVCLAGAMVGAGVSVSDIVVDLLYDDRYSAAQFILPLLLLGAWFATLSIVNESMAYGLGKPRLNAGANAAKFAWLVISVPLAFSQHGLVAALIFISLADLPRYLFLTATHAEYRGQLVIQDAVATMILVGSAAFLRVIFTKLGWVSEFIPSVPAQLVAL